MTPTPEQTKAIKVLSEAMHEALTALEQMHGIIVRTVSVTKVILDQIPESKILVGEVKPSSVPRQQQTRN